MNKIIKNKIILFTLFALLVFLLLALIFFPKNKPGETYLSDQKIEELRLDYPIYNKDPEFLTTRPLTFQEVIEAVDSVVIGYIVDDELPIYQINLPLVSASDKAIYEKNKSLGFDQKIEFVQYKLKVEKLVAGAAVSDDIFLSYNAILIIL